MPLPTGKNYILSEKNYILFGKNDLRSRSDYTKHRKRQMYIPHASDVQPVHSVSYLILTPLTRVMPISKVLSIMVAICLTMKAVDLEMIFTKIIL